METVLYHATTHGSSRKTRHVGEFIETINHNRLNDASLRAFLKNLVGSGTFPLSSTDNRAFWDRLEFYLTELSDRWLPCKCDEIRRLSTKKTTSHFVFIDAVDRSGRPSSVRTRKRYKLFKACIALLHTIADPVWHQAVERESDVPDVLYSALETLGGVAADYLKDKILHGGSSRRSAASYLRVHAPRVVSHVSVNNDLDAPVDIGAERVVKLPVDPHVVGVLRAETKLDKLAIVTACRAFLFFNYKTQVVKNGRLRKSNDTKSQILHDDAALFAYFCQSLGLVDCGPLQNPIYTVRKPGGPESDVRESVGNRCAEAFVTENIALFATIKLVANWIIARETGGEQLSASARDEWRQFSETAEKVYEYIVKTCSVKLNRNVRWSTHTVSVVPAEIIVEHLKETAQVCNAKRIETYVLKRESIGKCYAISFPKSVDVLAITRTLQHACAIEPSLNDFEYLVISSKQFTFLIAEIGLLHATRVVTATQCARYQGERQAANVLHYPLYLQIAMTHRKIRSNVPVPEISLRATIMTIGAMILKHNDRAIESGILKCSHTYFCVYKLLPRLIALWPNEREQQYHIFHAWIATDRRRREAFIRKTKARQEGGVRRQIGADLIRIGADTIKNLDFLSIVAGFVFLGRPHAVSIATLNRLRDVFMLRSPIMHRAREKYPLLHAYIDTVDRVRRRQNTNKIAHKIDSGYISEYEVDIADETDLLDEKQITLHITSEIYLLCTSNLLDVRLARDILSGVFCPSIEQYRNGQSESVYGVDDKAPADGEVYARRKHFRRKTVAIMDSETKYADYNAAFTSPFPEMSDGDQARGGSHKFADKDYWQSMRCTVRDEYCPAGMKKPMETFLRVLEWCSLTHRSINTDYPDRAIKGGVGGPCTFRPVEAFLLPFDRFAEYCNDPIVRSQTAPDFVPKNPRQAMLAAGGENCRFEMSFAVVDQGDVTAQYRALANVVLEFYGLFAGVGVEGGRHLTSENRFTTDIEMIHRQSINDEAIRVKQDACARQRLREELNTPCVSQTQGISSNWEISTLADMCQLDDCGSFVGKIDPTRLRDIDIGHRHSVSMPDVTTRVQAIASASVPSSPKRSRCKDVGKTLGSAVKRSRSESLFREPRGHTETRVELVDYSDI